MKALPQMLSLEGHERPRYEFGEHTRTVRLLFDEMGDCISGPITVETEAYFRGLATAADELADAVGSRRVSLGPAVVQP